MKMLETGSKQIIVHSNAETVMRWIMLQKFYVHNKMYATHNSI